MERGGRGMKYLGEIIGLVLLLLFILLMFEPERIGAGFGKFVAAYKEAAK